jgi:peptidoglycan/xylan/chitin deacetylase (PgdA/CDA1 family)
MITKPTIFILTYHSVADIPYDFSVDCAVFEKHIAYIKKHFEPLSLATFARIVKGEYTPKKDAVLVTFDDGVEDNYTNAYPILKKYGVPAVIFFATDYAGKLHTGPQGFPFQFLTWEQAKKMTDEGLVRIESHTHTHPLLPRIPITDVPKEMEVSRTAILHALGYAPVSIAYPKGEYNEDVCQIACEYYSLGFVGAGGYVTLPVRNPYTIERMMISRKVPFWKFAFMLKRWPWKVRSIIKNMRVSLYR